MNFRVESMSRADWPDVRAIYEEGIATGNATFETEAPEWAEWDARHLEAARLVARVEDKVVAWAALSPGSSRCAYAGVAEVSVYVAQLARGVGIGSGLMTMLIRESEGVGIWTWQAGIFPENEPSVRLHRRLGFREVGYRERITQLAGVWRDVLLFERRSRAVGV